MTHRSASTAQHIEKAISQFVQQHPDTTIVFQLPGMEASTLGEGEPQLTVSSLQDLGTQDPSALEESWSQTLVSVRNGEFSHLVIDAPDGSSQSLKIVPTNQDS